MGYDVIEKLTGLCTAGSALPAKLSEAAGLILECVRVDQCSIYLWHDESSRFVLNTTEGDHTSRIESYAEDEGVPGFVNKGYGIVEVYTEAPADTGFEGATDPGLAGFVSACLLPLRDDHKLYGVLYLKSRKKTSLTDTQRALLDAVAAQLVLIFKFEEMLESNRAVSSELEEYRVRLKNAEKLMVLGDMAATLAHEIKNPLVSIGGFASRLKRKLGPGSPDIKYVEQMISEIHRLEKVLNGAMSVVRDDVLDLKPDDINDILEDALGLFDEEFGIRGIKLVKDFFAEPLSVMADREELKIAFDNLIANAIQSMDEGGTLTLSTSISDGWVVAEVSDSGGGIDPGHLCEIFNPFYTTKERGTGLGLPITNSIIMRHKGKIDVTSKKGIGATFVVKLPAAEKSSSC
jgi:signal transduction histidine kinase